MKKLNREKLNWIDRLLNGVALGLILALVCGCDPTLPTGYGRASGYEYSGSVNGTIVFHEMIESTGRSVDRYSKFSPRWDKYETVYWMPDSFEPPDENLIAEIENWLAGDSHRTLVFIARDYDAAMQYWGELSENTTNRSNHEQLNREYYDAATTYLSRKHIGQLQECVWYATAKHPYSKPKEVSGPLTVGIDTAELDIRYSTLPAPGDVKESGSFGEYGVEVLMSVDSFPFIYSLEKNRLRESQIVVVGNASFLLNYSLANQANRELAAELLAYVGEFELPEDDVLFIESEFKLPISNRDAPDVQSQWHWITQKPLRYIVPNVLFCCLLFCFVYFPIFGRPKKIKQKATSNFQSHIDALGQLVRKTKSRDIPKSWIDEYRRRHSNLHSSPDDDSK